MSTPAAEAKVAQLAGEAERLARAGQRQAAARLWDQVLALAPEHSGALNHLGAQALASGDVAGAEALLSRAVRGPAPPAIAHANLARVRLAQGDTDAALAELDRALKLEPAAFAAHFEKAAIYGRLGREKDQALAYQSALQVMPAAAVTPEARARPARRPR